MISGRVRTTIVLGAVVCCVAGTEAGASAQAPQAAEQPILFVQSIPGGDASGQTKTNASIQPTYDISTFRESKANAGSKSVYTHFNTLTAANWPLPDLLQEAFGVQRQLIVGLPSWAEGSRYDVDAKVSDPDMEQLATLPGEQRNGMLRELCERRLGLKWHFETRPEPVYELIVAKGGPKLKLAKAQDPDAGMSVGDAKVVATGVPISDLLKVLSRKLDRPVLDRTRLTGIYDFRLSWTEDELHPPPSSAQQTDSEPPLFTALRDQLGLRLQSARLPIQIVVVDRITPPNAN